MRTICARTCFQAVPWLVQNTVRHMHLCLCSKKRRPRTHRSVIPRRWRTDMEQHILMVCKVCGSTNATTFCSEQVTLERLETSKYQPFWNDRSFTKGNLHGLHLLVVATSEAIVPDLMSVFIHRRKRTGFSRETELCRLQCSDICKPGCGVLDFRHAALL